MSETAPRRAQDAALRLFVAVELPPEARDAIAERQRELRAQAPTLRWVRPEAIHLTLRFIGPVAPARLPPIERALAAAIPPFGPFTLRTAALGVFGGNRARLLWLGLDGDLDALDALRRAIDAALDSIALTRPDHDRFSPHLTLARVPDAAGDDDRRRVRALASTPPLPPVTFEVARVSLMRSELASSGARYEALRRFPS